MKKRLFLVCPAGKAEHFVREKFGEGSYFLTALGAVFKLKEVAYIEEIINFIEREAIEELIVVSDPSCRFMQSVLTKQKGFGTHAEHVLIHLLVEHYAYVMGGTTVAEQKRRLAELNVQRQIGALLAIDYFLQQVVLQKLQIKGFITAQPAGKLMAVDLQKGAFSI